MVPLTGGAARPGPPTVQEAFKRDPHGRHLYVLRRKSSHLIKIIDGNRLAESAAHLPSAACRTAGINSQELCFYLSMNSGLGAFQTASKR
jgi:hypothetical protein